MKRREVSWCQVYGCRYRVWSETFDDELVDQHWAVARLLGHMQARHPEPNMQAFCPFCANPAPRAVAGGPVIAAAAGHTMVEGWQVCRAMGVPLYWRP